ncbi:16S rRNA (guanine(966)-N(2))-methyltransferase RsmD [Paralcaligenes ureilyticus]|uniref:16S rRNA (Guanine(966)-N(2))-methyltransferase RsmD n=1 Tax=Paralcaligenes ureilyticus TaxID=627131 RepID=A0A4R3M0N8_9BURK|nr:16S rRNA (guanine(966)-N(2))-methyltransferase RsmD [Paralcaligenes ureilyticus]TCT06283.1 16S rRNA (guanine(966)-N(2))-methyltransferase RsmD [Paralcaligenes ureilyticus]
MKKHLVRIVGGDYRRTVIPVVDAKGLRPTPDRVRETLYNWLQHLWDQDFSARRVLDLFAGTGALGFEAASRGVEHVQMVESNPAAVTALQALRSKLQANQVHIHAGDARAVLPTLRATPFDLILLDPPFGHQWLEALWPALPPILQPQGLVYVEAESAISPPEPFELLRSGRAGQVHYHLLRFAAAQKKVNNPETNTP